MPASHGSHGKVEYTLNFRSSYWSAIWHIGMLYADSKALRPHVCSECDAPADFGSHEKLSASRLHIIDHQKSARILLEQVCISKGTDWRNTNEYRQWVLVCFLTEGKQKQIKVWHRNKIKCRLWFSLV